MFNSRFVNAGFAIALLLNAAMASAEPPAATLISWKETSPTALPTDWEVNTWGAPITAARDATDPKHPHAVRLDASVLTRSTLRSPAIDVAPGEVLHITAPVRVQNVSEGQGNVLLMCQFDGLGITANARFRRPGGAQKQLQTWQTIGGNVIVPPMATTMRLRLGFNFASGTCWWDAPTVHAAHDVVVRLDVPTGRLPHDPAEIPLVILNRADVTGEISIDVRARSQHRVTTLLLDGSAQQQLTAAFATVPAPGDIDVQATLNRGTDMFKATQTVTVRKALALPPVSPTHWLLEDGPPHIDGRVELSLGHRDLSADRLTIRLLDAQQKTLLQVQPISSLHDGLNAFALAPATPLPLGNYQVIAELTQPDGTKLTATQPWGVVPRSAVRVTLNADGYLQRNGKPIFPLGLFNGGGRMAENAQAGFTISHAYNAVRVFPDVEPDDQAAVDFLDSSLKQHMDAVTLVPLDFAFHQQWDAFRQRIRLLRNHPALLVWDEEEGIARGDMTVATLARMRQILAEEDPNHPLIVGDSRDAIQLVTDRSNFFPVDQMDLGMWWWYPIPAGIHPGNTLGGDELTNRFELTPPDFLTRRNTDKPLWVGVQAYKKPGKEGRYPTPAEQRLQAYESFICGAKGLMWYAGSVDGGVYLNPKEGNWDSLKALAGELREMQPVLMSNQNQPATFAPSSAPISAIIKIAGDRTVLLAANRDVTPLDVEFAIPAGFATANVFRENRQLTCAAGKLKDHFDAYAVHVYELTK